MIVLEGLAPAAEEGWWTLLELAEEGGNDVWMVIGGQMMHVLAAEYGAAEAVRPTQDADVVVNVRALRGGTEMLAAWLLDRGYGFDGGSPDEIGHRFVRQASGGGHTIFDVLAPEGLGQRTNTFTVRPARTVSVPGSTQAFGRADAVEVTVSGMSGRRPRSGVVQRPGLLGALIMKAAATQIAVRANSDRDWQDAALLLTLFENPAAAAASCGKTDRRRLRDIMPLMDRDHVGWANLDHDAYRRGAATLGFLLGSP